MGGGKTIELLLGVLQRMFSQAKRRSGSLKKKIYITFTVGMWSSSGFLRIIYIISGWEESHGKGVRGKRCSIATHGFHYISSYEGLSC